MKKPRRKTRKTAQKHPKRDAVARLALKWGCTQRTIDNWRRDGAPLSDDTAMLQWLAGQRSLPAGTQEILDAQRRVAAAPAQAAELVTAEPGAAHALARLQAAELGCARVYLESLCTGDPLLIRQTRKAWQEMALTMAKYEGLVQESQRITGSLVPKADTAMVLAEMGWLCRIFWQQVSDRISGEFAMRGGKWAPVAAAMKSGFETGFWAMLTTRKAHLDPVWQWVVDALSCDAVQDDAGRRTLQRQGESLRAMVEKVCTEKAQTAIQAQEDIDSGEYHRRIRLANGCNCPTCRAFRVAGNGKGTSPNCAHIEDRAAGRPYDDKV